MLLLGQLDRARRKLAHWKFTGQCSPNSRHLLPTQIAELSPGGKVNGCSTAGFDGPRRHRLVFGMESARPADAPARCDLSVPGDDHHSESDPPNRPETHEARAEEGPVAYPRQPASRLQELEEGVRAHRPALRRDARLQEGRAHRLQEGPSQQEGRRGAARDGGEETRAGRSAQQSHQPRWRCERDPGGHPRKDRRVRRLQAGGQDRCLGEGRVRRPFTSSGSSSITRAG